MKLCNTALQFFSSLPSTHDWLIQRTSSLPQDTLFVVVAEGQTAGHGRQGRTWKSPPNRNLYLSCGFSFPSSFRETGCFPQILALVAVESLAMGVEGLRLKWPNDLVVDSKGTLLKLGGVLGTVVDSCKAVVSLGLNVNMSRRDCEIFDRPITSLLCESGRVWDRKRLLNQILDSYRISLNQLFSEGFQNFQSRLEAFFRPPKGEILTFTQGGQKVEGEFVCLEPDGALRLQFLENNRVHTRVFYNLDL